MAMVNLAIEMVFYCWDCGSFTLLGFNRNDNYLRRTSQCVCLGYPLAKIFPRLLLAAHTLRSPCAEHAQEEEFHRVSAFKFCFHKAAGPVLRSPLTALLIELPELMALGWVSLGPCIALVTMGSCGKCLDNLD